MASPLAPRVKRSGPFDLLVPGLYAWGVTVAWPASQRSAPLEVRLLALAALVALVVGAGIAFVWPLWGRILGLWVFLLACVASWSKVSPALFLARLDPLQGTLGSLGWGLFAWSWARQHQRASETAPEVSSAVPRQRLPSHLSLILLAISVAAAIPMVLAWWVRGLERALVAHVVALAAAIALVTAAADLVDAGVRRTIPSQRADPMVRLRAAAPAVGALMFAVVLGAAWGLLR
jgi:hypothetical protein